MCCLLRWSGELDCRANHSRDISLESLKCCSNKSVLKRVGAAVIRSVNCLKMKLILVGTEAQSILKRLIRSKCSISKRRCIGRLSKLLVSISGQFDRQFEEVRFLPMSRQLNDSYIALTTKLGRRPSLVLLWLDPIQTRVVSILQCFQPHTSPGVLHHRQ